MNDTALVTWFEESARCIATLGTTCSSIIQKIAEAIILCFLAGNKVLLMGNGGSASQAQHFAAELVNRYRHDRLALPAIALTTDTSVLTSIGNDRAFAEIFERQIAALGRPGDIAWGLSTSGASPNMISAFTTARRMGLRTISFTGNPGNELAQLSDLALIVDATHTGRIQEAHLCAGHAVCELIEHYYRTRKP
ncbi:MAG: SIS domain-containing protein [Desulfobacterota bacterium]|nr:SIS domain-containing protein [Thermodesulfobacteriota bacterium]